MVRATVGVERRDLVLGSALVDPRPVPEAQRLKLPQQLNVDVEPEWDTSTTPSDRDAGPLGFSGMVSKDAEQATGLATLAGDGFSGGPSMPMLPNTWSPRG